MKILINTASTHKGGGVQVAKSFLEESRKYSENEYHVVLGQMLNELIDRKSYPQNYLFYSIGFRPATRVFSISSRDDFFKKIENDINPDVVFTTTGPSYWRPKVPHLTGYNLPHYIYRSSPFFDQLSLAERFKWDLKGYFIKYFFKKDSDAYVVQTDDVNQRLRKWLSTDRVFTVTNTCSTDYLNPEKFNNKLKQRGENEFRFLTLSSWHSHKNLDIIPKVVENLPDNVVERVKFILTLPKSVFSEKFSGKYQNNIQNIGPVKPDEGPSLYEECDALFLPTLLECFSASYAEAMAMEKPILTTDMGFAKSICKNAAVYFKPGDPADAAEKAKKMIEDSELRSDLVASGRNRLSMFDTPQERAEKYLSICEKLII